MKNIKIIGLLIISCFSTILWGQRTFEGQVIEAKSSDKEILQEIFKDQTLFTFDIAKFNSYVKANKEFSNFNLKIGPEIMWDINLEENELRSIDYMEIKMTDAGPIKLPRKECITYKGTLKGTAQQVRLNIEANRVWGFIASPKGTYYIEPLNKFNKNTEKDTYVLYESTDLVDHGHTCTADHNHTGHNQINDIKEDLIGEEKLAGDDCRKLEIATEADWEFHDDGLDDSDILGNLNLVEAIYESTFNMTFIVVFQNIWTTSADPYTTNDACESGGVEEQYAFHGSSSYSNIRRDINVLFSGKDFTGTTIGCAYTNAFGNDYPNNAHDTSSSSTWGAYCVNQWVSSEALRTVIVAHEMGHLFGASHNESNNNIMNAGIGSSTTQIFVSASQTEMNALMDYNSTITNDGRSALRIRDYPSDSNNSSTTFFADTQPAKSANQWIMDGGMLINSLFVDDEMIYRATEKIVLKPGYKAIIDDPGNSLKLEIGACDINGN